MANKLTKAARDVAQLGDIGSRLERLSFCFRVWRYPHQLPCPVALSEAQRLAQLEEAIAALLRAAR